MYDELTEVDIQKMKDEIDYRTRELRPKLIEEVKVARGFGDLSENFEYKAAKREKNRNDSRIRYLQRMVDTAKVISDHSSGDVVGLFDKVVIYIPDDDEEQTIRLVTTLRQNALEGLISKESPVGKAVMGHKKGDRVTTIGGMVGKIVQVNDSTIVFETSEDRVRIEVTKWAVQSTGAMEQAAAQKSGKKADKVEEKVEETPAVEEKATETVEAPAAEEKPSYDPEIK